MHAILSVLAQIASNAGPRQNLCVSSFISHGTQWRGVSQSIFEGQEFSRAIRFRDHEAILTLLCWNPYQVKCLFQVFYHDSKGHRTYCQNKLTNINDPSNQFQLRDLSRIPFRLVKSWRHEVYPYFQYLEKREKKCCILWYVCSTMVETVANYWKNIHLAENGYYTNKTCVRVVCACICGGIANQNSAVEVSRPGHCSSTRETKRDYVRIAVHWKNCNKPSNIFRSIYMKVRQCRYS